MFRSYHSKVSSELREVQNHVRNRRVGVYVESTLGSMSGLGAGKQDSVGTSIAILCSRWESVDASSRPVLTRWKVCTCHLDQCCQDGKCVRLISTSADKMQSGGCLILTNADAITTNVPWSLPFSFYPYGYPYLPLADPQSR